MGRCRRRFQWEVECPLPCPPSSGSIREAEVDDGPGGLGDGEPGGVEAEVGLGPRDVITVRDLLPPRQIKSLDVAHPLLGAAPMLGLIGADELDGEKPGAQV